MKRMIFAVMLLVSAQAASAQYYQTDSAKGFDPSRLLVGGSVGFSFGDYTFINISPLIGYRLSPKFAAGININAQYASQRLKDNTGFTYERNNYTMFGGGVFARFYPIEQFFLHAQPEYNSITVKRSEYDFDPVKRTKDRYGAPSLLLGGGYAQPIGANAAFTFMVLYDVLQDKNSPYMNRPIFSGGINVGF